ncbi:MAG: hypothetical protein U1E10_06670 [Bdellovibrionales bacterium]|nr:hypothetical protein [Bdellovibrionales bacterium]
MKPSASFFLLVSLCFLLGSGAHQRADAARGPSEEVIGDHFARVSVEAPKELLLGKIQHAQVAITLPLGASVLEVSARSEGTGVGLPLARKWRFVDLKSGKAAVFKVPYQLTRKFQKGALHFDIKTVGIVGTSGSMAKKRAPAQHQTATLRLSR